MQKYSKGIIFTVIFIDLLGFGIIIPLLPTFASKIFTASDTEIGFLLASFSLAQFIFGPFWGRLSDEIGRKPVIIISLIGNIFAYALFGFANSITLLFVSRILAGACAGNISAAQAYMADITEPKDRAKSMGLIGMAFSLGFVLGPFFGGMLSKYGYAVPGFFAAVLSFFALVLAILKLEESLDKSKLKEQVKRKFNLSNLWDALTHPNIGILIILFFMSLVAVSIIYSVMALFFYKNFGFTDQTTGSVLGFIGFIGAISQGSIGMMTKIFAEKKILIISTFLAVIGILSIPLVHSFPFLLLVMVPYAIGTGLVQTLVPSIISQYIEPEEQGGILGINQSLGALGRVFGPIIGGYIFETFGHDFPFIISGSIMVLVFLLSFLIKNKHTLKKE